MKIELYCVTGEKEREKGKNGRFFMVKVVNFSFQQTHSHFST